MVLHTDSAFEGHGLTFTCGRGTELSDSPQAAQATETDPGNVPQSATPVSAEKRPRVLHDEHKELVKVPAGTNEVDKIPNE